MVPKLPPVIISREAETVCISNPTFVCSTPDREIPNWLLNQQQTSGKKQISQLMSSQPPQPVFIFILTVPAGLGNPLIATNKLSLATWGSYYQQDHMGPGTYAFGYDIEDPVTGNIQFKQEERHPNGTVTGSYGYVDAYGKPHVVTYVADENGYRAKVEIEGEPTKHFPEVSTLPANSLHVEQSNEVGSAGKHAKNEDVVVFGVPLQRELHLRPPPTYRFISPSYYEYLRAYGVLE